MILKKLPHQNDSVKIMRKGKVLFQFEKGEFETDDKDIIEFWSNVTNPNGSKSNEEHEPEEVKPKKRGRPKKGE
jgi:hypothetical protein